MQYAFEHYVIDSDRRELTRSAEPIAVGPQVFDLLLHLVRNREHVVSKDELLDAVWAGRIVSESTLSSHINAARTAIGDSGQQSKTSQESARLFREFPLAIPARQPARASAMITVLSMACRPWR